MGGYPAPFTPCRAARVPARGFCGLCARGRSCNPKKSALQTAQRGPEGAAGRRAGAPAEVDNVRPCATCDVVVLPDHLAHPVALARDVAVVGSVCDRPSRAPISSSHRRGAVPAPSAKGASTTSSGALATRAAGRHPRAPSPCRAYHSRVAHSCTSGVPYLANGPAVVMTHCEEQYDFCYTARCNELCSYEYSYTTWRSAYL